MLKYIVRQIFVILLGLLLIEGHQGTIAAENNKKVKRPRKAAQINNNLPQIQRAKSEDKNSASKTDPIEQSLNVPTQIVEPMVIESPVLDTTYYIAQNAIEPFLTKPRVEDAKKINTQPIIVAADESRVYLYKGDIGYTTEIKSEENNWQIYHPNRELVDPESKKTLGIEYSYRGVARVLTRGNPTKIKIESSTSEIVKGDLLYPAPEAEIQVYQPHRPTKKIEARIVAVSSGVRNAGKDSVLIINKGKSSDLEVGNILKIVRGKDNTDLLQKGGDKEIKLPNEDLGMVFVFKVFENVSYVLVTSSVLPITISDRLITP
jgi:hypothetical protein